MFERTLVVGIGSHHGDDRFGWLAAEAMASRSEQEIDVRIAQSPADLLHMMEGVERIVICDACRGGAGPGTIRHWIWPATEIQQTVFGGTHDLNLPTVLQLAAQLGQLPAEVVVWSAEAKRFEPGEMPSPEIAAAAKDVSLRIREGLFPRHPLG